MHNSPKARILHAIGRTPLDRIGPKNVAAWFDAAGRDKPGATNRAAEMLRAMMFRAEEWELRGRGSNPCLGIAKNPRNRIARFLDADKLARLGRALDTREAELPDTVAATRLLTLTGCRRSEVLNLCRRDIGADAINLPVLEDWPAPHPSQHDRAGACRRAVRCTRPRCVPVSALRQGWGRVQPRNPLARGLIHQVHTPYILPLGKVPVPNGREPRTLMRQFRSRIHLFEKLSRIEK